MPALALALAIAAASAGCCSAQRDGTVQAADTAQALSRTSLPRIDSDLAAKLAAVDAQVAAGKVAKADGDRTKALLQGAADDEKRRWSGFLYLMEALRASVQK